ncbi:alpha/beta hydrolase [Cryobacterium melibiosiphilum]|uniref:Alpha/beta hydrolase n=1 Tax=Cryobacterium melibiosiphilum TaxID=995039 RepID=A0A3A5MDD3_9MICO|nr:alpha/beta hydrolase [Cryobacterium melibiosiphilum]RJT88140.1 alpha/beta hydrolase [Cryobacterium melibiosiphilum]
MTRKRRRTPLIAAIAAAVAVTLALSGCSGLFQQAAPQTSTPTGESVAGDLEPFYSQVLEWENCANGMQCTTATAPLNWDDPDQGEIELALIRQVATGDRIGSLLVNPGGPGASGYDMVANSVDFATDEKVQEGFDVVGFDPRGVGRSTPVSCYDDADMDAYLYDLAEAPRGTDEWIAELETASAAFGAACSESTGALLEYVDTENAARDLDLLRATLGDDALNYLGYSYGTFLGATYAELYPDKVGRLVLDGALDPSTSNFDVTKTQAVGFENALRAYLDGCLAEAECPFTGTVDDAMTTVAALLASVDASPIAAADGRELGSGTLLTAIIYPLYSQASWPVLSQMFDAVMFGSADEAFSLADQYNGRTANGTYGDNSTEAFLSINCIDYAYNDDPAAMRAQAAEITAAAPIIGTYLSFGDIGCANWPYAFEGEREPIHAAGAAPILVIGTTNDPATPYVWAESLAEQLDSGQLVTYDGEGHTAYNKSNQCVNDAVDDYLLDGIVPATDPLC